MANVIDFQGYRKHLATETHPHVSISERSEYYTRFEAWDADTVDAEVAAFESRAVQLRAASVKDVLRRLGEPDSKHPGSQILSEVGVLLYQADEEYGYFRLLPHVAVWLSIKHGQVHYLHYTPKWRRCPVEAQALLGGEYAPE